MNLRQLFSLAAAPQGVETLTVNVALAKLETDFKNATAKVQHCPFPAHSIKKLQARLRTEYESRKAQILEDLHPEPQQ
jgi:hypothetical protein